MPIRPAVNRSTAVLALAVLAVGGAAQAASLRYKPGMWKTTTTMRVPMLPSPQVRTSTECLRDDDYSAERLMRDQQGCRVEAPVVTATSMRWTATCAIGDGSATGRGEFAMSDDGERGRGTITIDMSSGGQQTTMTMDVESERVGDCN